ncbi:MAG: GntR family transcriptional regulator [Paracoccaceae bacterium]|nr:GntR family transcriptional regulator [Paracoccaceae bacterium]
MTKQSKNSAGLPTHELVYRQLRDMILFGELVPGQAVTMQGLTERLGAGMTPVREALRRLIAEGALVAQGNRRISVLKLTPANVDELIFARQAIDAQLVFKATGNVTSLNMKTLSDEDTALDAALIRGDIQAYLRHNYRFHALLYEIADAPILSALALRMWLLFGPSLRVVCGRIGTQSLIDQHKEVLAAIMATDAERASDAIRADVLQGMEQARQSITTPLDEHK